LIAFHVIDHKAEVIVVHVDSVQERFDDVPAEKRIMPVAFCKTVKEKYHAVPV
jgi:hypothetical protein